MRNKITSVFRQYKSNAAVLRLAPAREILLQPHKKTPAISRWSKNLVFGSPHLRGGVNKSYSADYCPICLATSSAKFSSRFSMPSPVSKRTIFSILRDLSTEARY